MPLSPRQDGKQPKRTSAQVVRLIEQAIVCIDAGGGQVSATVPLQKALAILHGEVDARRGPRKKAT